MNSPQLHFYNLADDVTAFSSKRQGGVSTGNYSSFNINRYCGDSEENVEANRQLFCSKLGIDINKLIYPHQVHDTVVKRIDEAVVAMPSGERDKVLEGVDALMTNLKGVCIGVSTADCIPVLLYDPVHHACCAVHAGWRGTVKRITEKAVEAMADTYGSDPLQMRAVIGPGISLESFEVGDEVYEAFQAGLFPMDRIARKYEKWHIDLWEANRLMLLDKGLAANNITVDGTCTYKNAGEYFSARRLGIASGRIFTGILR